MKVNFDSYTDEFKADFKQHAQEVWPEVRQLLPDVAELNEMTFWFNNEILIPRMQTGGTVLDKTTMVLAAAVKTPYDELVDEMRSTLFHEAYHLVQGFTDDFDGLYDLSALENGTWEGAACVFEMTHTDSLPYYAEYDQKFINKWLPSVQKLGPDWMEEDYRRWKFWDKETDTNHILYRVGTYVADQAVEKSGKPIEDLATLSAKELIELAEFDT